MIEFTCFTLWFLGAYVAGVAFSETFDWGPTRIGLAIIFWPVLTAVALLVSLLRAALRKWEIIKEGW